QMLPHPPETNQSKQIRLEHPSVYQLTTKKEQHENLTRVMFGERNLNKTNRTILLVGETGTGKSTLIDALLNYAIGVKFEEEIWFQIVEEERGCQIESQTSDVIVYQIYGFEDKTLPYSLTIVDTPGYGDTRNQELDAKVAAKLLSLFGQANCVNEINAVGLVMKASDNRLTDRLICQTETQTSDVIVYQIFDFKGQILSSSLTIIDTPGFGYMRGLQHDEVSQILLELFRSEEVHEINAVGLVMKATDNSLSDRLMYVLNSAMSLFGKDLEENIVALITHSDGRNPRNALQALEAANIKSSNREFIYFVFNNCQHEDRAKNRELLEIAYQTSLKGFKEFMLFLDETKPQKLKTTVEVLKERTQLTACIQNLQQRIKEIELKQNEIQKIKEAYNKYQEQMKENEDFSIEVDDVYKKKKSIRGGMWLLVFYEGALTCSVCEENCHYPGCTIAWSPGRCQVMKDGRCTVCTNKCPASDHVKENWRYKIKTRKLQKTLEDVKEKYEKNKAECEKKLTLLENLEKENDNLTSKWSLLLDEAYSHVIRLEKIALKVESVSTLVHLDFLMEKMREKGDQEKVKKLEEMKSRVNEGTNTALRYAKNS
uniref:Septin-type G domain-containing protein n=1 Tax=Cyprinodon variegatus TaxID=28743 RepID=A0A3Q2CLQ6_CYPVA